jgi:hypothetical protein
MKNTGWFVFICILVFFTESCAEYKPATSVRFKKTVNYACRGKQKNVFLYYDSLPPTFRYKALGNIEASGKANENDQEIIDRLKYTAFQNCANAIVKLKTEISTKNYGSDYRTGSKTYLAKTYRGLAVRIESDSLYKSHALGNWLDLSFMKNTIKDHHDRKKKSMATAAAAIGTSLLFIGIFAYTAYR